MQDITPIWSILKRINELWAATITCRGESIKGVRNRFCIIRDGRKASVVDRDSHKVELINAPFSGSACFRRNPTNWCLTPSESLHILLIKGISNGNFLYRRKKSICHQKEGLELDNSRTIPVKGALLTCPRCFAENDKSTSIERMRSEMKSGRRDQQGTLVARCIACDVEILVVCHGDGRTDVVDISPYEDVQEEAISPNEIPAAPSPKTDDQATSSYEEGLKHFRDGHYQEAYAYWRAAYDWFCIRPDSSGMASGLLSNVGMALSRLQNPCEALCYFERALSGMDQDESPEAYATVLNNIGGAYLHLGRMDQAEEYHRRAYELHVSKGSEEGLLARERHNLAFTYAKMAWRRLRSKELDKAIESVRHAAALYDEPALVAQGRLYFLMLGNLLRRKGDQIRAQLNFEGALGYYQEAFHYHERAEADELLVLQDSNRLSEVNRELGRIDQALETMEKSDELLEALSKRPPMPLAMFKKRGRFALTLRRVIQRVSALFTGYGSSVRDKTDEL